MNETYTAAILAFLVAASPLFASEATSGNASRTEYIVVLNPAGMNDTPNVDAIGGKAKGRWKNRINVELPDAAARQLAKDERVKYLARIGAPGERYTPNELDVATQRAVHSARIAPMSGSVIWDSGKYAYDGAGNIVLIGGVPTDTRNSYGAQSYFVYDPLSRLKEAAMSTDSHRFVEAFDYDGFGNLELRKTWKDGVRTDNSTPADSLTNRLQSAGYDRAGNMSAWANDTYAYDAVNMMHTLDHPGDRNVQIYTASDERLAVFYEGQNYSRWTVRDLDGKVLREFENGRNGGWLWIEDFIHANGQILAAQRVEAEGGRRQFLNDHLGTPRVVTNYYGEKLTEHVYLPFGIEATPTTQEIARGFDREQPLRFTGHERDFLGSEYTNNENYLDYMHARYYSPGLGRFLSADPYLDLRRNLLEPQRWNRFSYVINGPSTLTDPDGRNPVTTAVVTGYAIDVAGLSFSWLQFQNNPTLLNGALVAVDAALTLHPTIPNTGAARLAWNRIMGSAFERSVIDALGATKNSAGVTEIASRVTTIPDLPVGSRFGVTDIKNVLDISSSSQLRSQFSAAKTAGFPFNLIISPRTNSVSSSVRDMVALTGGKIFIFDPKTKKFAEAVFDGTKVVR